ncbi:MAG: hypothetical protein JRF64_05045 [Deltaproteobacteria bacterium]|nr:hypothetical protein [Deltaproteobacteria bacterium]
MTDTKQQVERREHKRFPVTKDTFVALKPDYFKVGRIMNISMAGLAFSYMADGKPLSQSSGLDIFLVDRTFHLRDVPFRRISDVESDRIPFSSAKMRRSGVQFGELTAYQSGRLKYFIENHTNGEEKV